MSVHFSSFIQDFASSRSLHEYLCRCAYPQYVFRESVTIRYIIHTDPFSYNNVYILYIHLLCGCFNTKGKFIFIHNVKNTWI